ncbi:MAG: HNH endonuclease, partial [Clostridiales bacterium]|nr:HNH endonuclease [Clostridiales bacterium]
MVYVINMQGEPLMPCKEAKARKLLKNNLATVFKREPFTIKLLFECENKVQDITLGIDAGSKFIGISATTSSTELFSAELELRNDIVDLLSTRRQNRRTRRSRLRYRKPRFLNRVKSKNKGWLAPSIENKIQTHISIVTKVHQILPISKIVVETASF